MRKQTASDQSPLSAIRRAPLFSEPSRNSATSKSESSDERVDPELLGALECPRRHLVECAEVLDAMRTDARVHQLVGAYDA